MSDLLQEARWIIRECAPSKLLMGAFSGGKDSIVVHRVCEIEKVRPEWHYHVTTIDPPEVVQFIRKNYPSVHFDKPRHGYFFKRARQKNLLPSRRYRWCCDEYKESRGPLNCTWITGVRREESPARNIEPVVGLHRRSRRVHVRPLSNWDAESLWDFIHIEKLVYPNLYDEGFHRLGCVGCPLATRYSREREMNRWPYIGEKWVALAKHYYLSRNKTQKWDNFESFEEFFNVWMNGKL